MYAFKYLFCDLLNVVNVIGQIYFINFFLGGVFMTYGTEVIDFMNMDDANRTDPMMKVFPRVTKCTFHHYGPSGTVNKKDALCILGLNIINEKIYVTLWFWLVILACMTAVYLIYVVAIIKQPVDIHEGLSRELAVDYAKRIGFTPGTEDQAADIFLKLYELFLKKDCTLLEINPFTEVASGEVLCMDCKLSFDDNA